MTDAKNTDVVTPTTKPELHWRFEFGSYAETRRFLDRLADLSKREDYYPNVSFGKTYANVSIDAEGQTSLGAREADFIQEMKSYTVQDQA